LISDGRKKKSDEWDVREKEWTEEMRRQNAVGNGKLKRPIEGRKERKVKKFNPKNRFRLMLVCLAVLAFSIATLFLTIFNANTTFQAAASMFSTIISGVIFIASYGRDIMVTLLNEYTKSSLR
jgi:hypothetical protein